MQHATPSPAEAPAQASATSADLAAARAAVMAGMGDDGKMSQDALCTIPSQEWGHFTLKLKPVPYSQVAE